VLAFILYELLRRDIICCGGGLYYIPNLQVCTTYLNYGKTVLFEVNKKYVCDGLNCCDKGYLRLCLKFLWFECKQVLGWHGFFEFISENVNTVVRTNDIVVYVSIVPIVYSTKCFKCNSSVLSWLFCLSTRVPRHRAEIDVHTWWHVQSNYIHDDLAMYMWASHNQLY